MGSERVPIAMMDGPITADHPDLAGAAISEVGGGPAPRCRHPGKTACLHGTFVAGILVAGRGSETPGICPGSPLLVRPIFSDAPDGSSPTASTREAGRAIADCVKAGARVINMSSAVGEPSTRVDQALHAALDHAALNGVIVVAAAGNDATLGSSVVTRHPWVIPVAGCDMNGQPTGHSNLGGSLGRAGLCAPGERVKSLSTAGGPTALTGTSFAAPFVTGAVALLWSQFPEATAADVRYAVTHCETRRRRAVVPPLLDAWAAFEFMRSHSRGWG